ncbi:MAG: LysM peptidoglycan-binding domain-containing protein [Flavobacterium sp.]|nr:LysM peptidoglycan-binding domain-containing protein [Flavobacterium sp.]
MKLFYVILVLLFTVNISFTQISFIKYKVEKRETIFDISKKFNIDSEEILKSNPDAVLGVIENQILFIPNTIASNATIHIVEPKENLFSIARIYNVSVQDLANLNEQELQNGLRIGMKIIIPNKKKTIEGKARIITAESLFHVVEAKETKYSISKKYGISIDQLESQNPEIVNGLSIGTKLAINTKQIKPLSDKEELMVALAEKQVAIEKTKAVLSENEKLKVEKNKTNNEVEILKDSLTVQKGINEKVISVNGMDVKLADLEYKNGSSVEKLRLVLEANKNIQAVLVAKLQSLVSDMRQDVELLKIQDIPDLEASMNLEQKSSNNLIKTNEALQILKKDLAENRKTYTNIMFDVQRVTIETNNEYKKKVRENAQKPADILALDEIKKMQAEQDKNEKLNKLLFNKIEVINTERLSIVKNKMKMATFYSEEARTFDDKMALERLKRYKKAAIITQNEDKYKFKDRNEFSGIKKGFKTVDIEVIKNLKDTKNGFYLVLGIFKEAKERDAYVMKLIDAGEVETTFFYNNNSFTYYVYTKTFVTVNDALKGFKQVENKKMHDKMKIVKLENFE